MRFNIPNEILCLIAEALDSQQDRFRLAVSCRRLSRLLLPILYSHVALGGIRNISSLLYTVVRNDELAVAVRFLELHPWDVRDNHGLGDVKFEYDAKLMHKLVLKGRCSEERANWIKDLESGIDDAWLALLLPRLKGLRRINIVWPRDSVYVAEMFAKAASADVPVFPHLEEAYAAWHDTEGGADTAVMLPFFKLPAMRKIGGYSLVYDYNSDDKQTMTRFSTITEIDLLNSNSYYGLRNWIESCQALRRFRISCGGALVSDDEFDAPAIHQSLQLHKTTLESVWICLNNEENVDNSEVGSFAEFAALKTLHVNVSLLGLVAFDKSMGSRQLTYLLPPSLENLFLCDCSSLYISETCKQLEDLINLGVVPNLMRLGLQYGCIHYSLRRQQEFEPLKHRCKEAGIVFNVHGEECAELGDKMGFDWPFHEFTIDWG